MPYLFQSKKILFSLVLGALACLLPVQVLAAHNHAAMAMDHSAHARRDTKAAQPTEHKDHKKCLHNGICYMGSFCAMLMQSCHQPGNGHSGQTCSLSNECGTGSGSLVSSQAVSKEFIPSSAFVYNISFVCSLLRPPKEFSLTGFAGELEDPPRVFPLL